MNLPENFLLYSDGLVADAGVIFVNFIINIFIGLMYRIHAHFNSNFIRFWLTCASFSFFGFWILQSEISLRICDGVSLWNHLEYWEIWVDCLLFAWYLILKKLRFYIFQLFSYFYFFFFLHSISYNAMITVNWNVNTKIYTI